MTFARLLLNFKIQSWIFYIFFWGGGCNIRFTIILLFAVIQIGPLSIHTLTVFLGSFEILHHNIIVWPAEDSILQKSAFFPCRKLAFTRGAGETSQVEGATSRPTHPVTRMDVTPTTGTASPIPPGTEEKKEKKSVFIYERLSSGFQSILDTPFKKKKSFTFFPVLKIKTKKKTKTLTQTRFCYRL